MTTIAEHNTADFTRSLIENGQSVVIDGELVQCFAKDLDPLPGMYPGVTVIRRGYWFAHTTLMPLPPSGSTLVIDGTEWMVERSTPSAVSDHLTVQRNIA